MISKYFRKFEFDLVRYDLFFVFLALLTIGAITFFSATLGILSRNEIKFYSIIESQSIAYIIGIALFIFGFLIKRKFVQKYAVYFYGMSVILCISVFVNEIGMKFGGSTRWLSILGYSLQPGDILKLATVITIASFFAVYKNYFSNELKFMMYFVLLILIPSIIMFFQKDLGTLFIIYYISLSVLFVSRTKTFYLILIAVMIILSTIIYVNTNDYVKNRFLDYKSEIKSEQGISYQSKQALIAIGAGEMLGRGAGQSIQKFYYLPEPAGDSIFAVYLEEYGFFGGVVVILLFMYLILRILYLSYISENDFVKYYLTGFAAVILAQCFLNMGSMIGVIPISGDTLPLFSQGGTALICYMFGFGFMLQLTKKPNL